MIIKKILTQNRRDLTVLYTCEHCGDECEGIGYDDTHFYENVVPDMPCKKCGKSQQTKQATSQPRYPQQLTV